MIEGESYDKLIKNIKWGIELFELMCMLFYPPHPLHDLIYSLHLNKNERRH